MNIEKKIEGNTATLSLNGWMDTKSAPEFAGALGELEPSVEKLVLDLKGLEYTSSAGVRQIVAAHKKMNGALTLKNLTPEVLDVLKMTGLDKRLTIE